MAATHRLLLLAVLAVSAMGCSDAADARQQDDLNGPAAAVVEADRRDEHKPGDGSAVRDPDDARGADLLEETHDLDDPPASGEDDPCGEGRIDINAADPHELERIVHIGPARAAQLEELRPFRNLRDLTRVAGIAEKRLTDIVDQGLACVVDSTAPEP